MKGLLFAYAGPIAITSLETPQTNRKRHVWFAIFVALAEGNFYTITECRVTSSYCLPPEIRKYLRIAHLTTQLRFCDPLSVSCPNKTTRKGKIKPPVDFPKLPSLCELYPPTLPCHHRLEGFPKDSYSQLLCKRRQIEPTSLLRLVCAIKLRL